MSKQELKNLQNQLSDKMNREGVTVDFYHHHETLKPTLDEIQRACAERQNAANEKDYEWMKWLIAIAAGVFSVIVSQMTRMPSVLDSQSLLIQSNQLTLFKIAIITNALGIIFGAIYLYTDIRSERDLVDKLSIQRLHLLLKGTNRYENVIPSDNFHLFFYCKRISLICFLACIGAWVAFIWIM